MTVAAAVPLELRPLQKLSCLPAWSSRNNVLTFWNRYSNGIVVPSVRSKRLYLPCNPLESGLKHVDWAISATSSGLETSITDPEDNAVSLKNAQIAVESEDESKLQLRVNVTGKETQLVFNKVLNNLASSAPPIPGFRREKGGKTTKVPREFLLQFLGEERVTKFVIQEIVSSTVADYAKKENLKVKENKVSTIQTVEELRKTFSPGNELGFTATLELEEPEVPETGTESSETAQ